MPECIPFKDPGANVTGQATADVVGGRFLAITGDMLDDGSLRVAHAAAGARAAGVSAYDAVTGRKVGVIRGPKTVVPVLAAAAIGFGAEVESDAQGRAIPLAAGVANGYVETSAESGQDARVVLY